MGCEVKLSDLKVGDKFRFANSIGIWGNVIAREYRGFVNGAHTFTLQDIGVGWENIDHEVELITDPPVTKYRVGDRVRIKEDADKYMEVRSGMRKYLGKTATVKYINDENWLQCDNSWHWHPEAVELAPEPQYRPYSDLRPLVGKVVKHRDGSHGIINWADATYFQFGGADADLFPAQQLLANYTHLDGTPCGELVTEQT